MVSRRHNNTIGTLTNYTFAFVWWCVYHSMTDEMETLVDIDSLKTQAEQQKAVRVHTRKYFDCCLAMPAIVLTFVSL